MTAPRIAALIYDRHDGADAVLDAFAARRSADGLRIAGLLDAAPSADVGAGREMALRDLTSGATVSICQDLGTSATGCRIDPRGLAAASALLRSGLEARPDLAVVNKFGKMEADGLGLADEIGRCVADGVPMVIGVPRRFLAAWNAFAGGLDSPLPCNSQALEDWWSRVAVADPAAHEL